MQPNSHTLSPKFTYHIVNIKPTAKGRWRKDASKFTYHIVNIKLKVIEDRYVDGMSIYISHS